MSELASLRKRMLESLIDCSGDKTDGLNDQLTHSIGAIATEDPTLVVEQLYGALKDGKRLTGSHRVAVFKITRQVVSDHGKRVPLDVLGALGKQASESFATPGEVQEALHTAAASVVVACAEFVPEVAITALQSQIPANALPPLFTLKGLADIAKRYPAAFVPRMRPVLAALLPLVGMVRQDNMRWAFSAAFGHFAGALLRVREPELLGDSPVGGAPSGGVEEYQDSMLAAVTALLEWIGSKELPVRLAAAEAASHVAACVGEAQLGGSDGVYKKVLSAVVGLLKKEKTKDAAPALVGMNVLLCVGAVKCRVELAECLESVYGVLTGCLSTLTSATSGTAELDPDTVRAHSEVLRCFEPLARGHADAVLGLVQRPLEPRSGVKETTPKPVALVVLRHIVMRNDQQLTSLYDTVISIARLALGDNDWKVRRALVQLVLSMGQDKRTYLSCEGATDLIFFVFQMAGLSKAAVAESEGAKGGKDTGGVAGDVRRIAGGVVQLFMQAPELDAVMWPAALELMAESRKNDALLGCGVLLLATIATVGARLRSAQSELYFINFGRFPNLAPPTSLIPRVLVYLAAVSSPTFTAPRDSRVAATRVVTALGPLLDFPRPSAEFDAVGPVGKLWLQHGPALAEYADDTANFIASDWEEVLHKLLSKTIQARESVSEEWSMKIVSSFSEDLPGYCRSVGGDPIAQVALSMTGLAAARCQRRDVVASALEVMLSAPNHSSLAQRRGCAKGLGYLAQAYTDAVLERVGQIAKGGEVKKSFFGKSKEKGAAPDELKAAVALGLGHVGGKTPLQLITSRVEQYVFPQLLLLCGDASRSSDIRAAALEGLAMVGAAMKKQPDFAVRSKDTVVMAVVPLASLSKSSLVGSLKALTAMVEIQNPPLSSAAYAEVVRLVSRAVGGSAVRTVVKEKGKEKEKKEEKEKKDDTATKSQGDMKAAAAAASASAAADEEGDVCGAVCDLVRALLHSSQQPPVVTAVTIARFCIIPAAVSERAEEREMALKVLARLFSDFPEGEGAAAVASGVHDVVLGSILSRALARLGDKALAVQEAAIRVVAAAVPRLSKPDADADAAVKQLHTALATLPDVPFSNVARGVATLFTTTLRDSALVAAVRAALEGDDDSLPGATLKEVAVGGDKASPTASSSKTSKSKDKDKAAAGSGTSDDPPTVPPPAIDAQSDGAAAVAVFLNATLKHAGGHLSQTDVGVVFEALFKLLDPLVGTPQDVLANGLLHATKALAKHHPSAAFDVLFERSVPHTPSTKEAILVYGADPALAPAFVRQSMDVLVNYQLYQDASKTDRQRRGGGKNRDTFAHASVAAATFEEGGFVVTPAHLAAASVLATVAGAEAGRTSVEEVLPDVFCALVMLVSSAHEAAGSLKDKSKDNGGVAIAAAALRQLLTAMLKPATVEAADGALKRVLNPAEHVEAYRTLLDALIADEEKRTWTESERLERKAAVPPTPRLKAVYDYVEPYAQKDYDGLKLCACSLLGEALWHLAGEEATIGPCVNALLARSGPEEADSVKAAALTGLGGVAAHSSAAAAAAIPTVISTLLASFVDRSPHVALLAVKVVATIVADTPHPAAVDPSLVTILQRARPLLTSKSPEMRSAAFDLLSACYIGAKDGRLSPLPVDQILHTLLPIMLLHMDDDDQRTRNVAKRAVHSAVGFMSAMSQDKAYSARMVTLFQDPQLAPEKRLADFDAFCGRFAAIFVTDFAARTSDFVIASLAQLKSPFTAIRAGAVIMVGHILHHVPESARKRTNEENAVANIVATLRKESEAVVRMKAARALGLIGTFAAEAAA